MFGSFSSFSLFCGSLFPNLHSVYFSPLLPACHYMPNSFPLSVSEFLLPLLPPAFLTFTFAPLCLCSPLPPLPSFHILRCVRPEHPHSSSASVCSKICQNQWVPNFRQCSQFRCSESHWFGEKRSETQKEKWGNKSCLHSIAYLMALHSSAAVDRSKSSFWWLSSTITAALLPEFFCPRVQHQVVASW